MSDEEFAVLREGNSGWIRLEDTKVIKEILERLKAIEESHKETQDLLVDITNTIERLEGTGWKLR